MMILNPYRYAAIAATTDDFSTNTLSSYTEFADTAANWSITGGFLVASTGSQAILTRNAVSFADGEISCVITEANDAGLVLRLANNNNYYVATIFDDSAAVTTSRNKVALFKRVGGTFTRIGEYVSIPTFTRGVAQTFSFSASGTNLVIKVNGVAYITQTDSALSAAGKCGPRTAGGAFKMDSFTWP